MDDILSQLGGLLLGAVPTVVFVVLVYGAYSALVHKPLAAVLGERYRRTEGAIEKARADIAAATPGSHGVGTGFPVRATAWSASRAATTFW